jgi:hypothetical protein
MPMPNGIGVIDLMLELPTDDRGTWYDFMKPLLMDQESREMFKFPAEYMFKQVPTVRQSDDYLGIALDEMDKYGIEKAMITVSFGVRMRSSASRRPRRSRPAACRRFRSTTRSSSRSTRPASISTSRSSCAQGCPGRASR